MTTDVHSREGAQLVLRDGRRLGYAQYGQPDGEPIVYFHGHPGSRLEARLAHEPAAAPGLRVIALDRPGYGLSDFLPGRAITDWPADVTAAADALGIGRFSVAGASGGGPRWAGTRPGSFRAATPRCFRARAIC
jgi:pimeloyl-ACP methyl ester carboxylesterase